MYRNDVFAEDFISIIERLGINNFEELVGFLCSSSIQYAIIFTSQSAYIK